MSDEDIWYELWIDGKFIKKYGSVASYKGWAYFNPHAEPSELRKVDYNKLA